MASGSQNMTTFKAKGLTSIANTVDTSNFIFLKSTALTADQLGNTVSLSLNAIAVTDAAMTNHSLFLNAGIGSGLGTPFQLQIPDSSHLYIYKRWYTSGAWSGWSKISAGHADLLTTARAINGTNFDGSADITTANWGTARTLTIGNKGQSVNGSANISWSLNDILYNATTIGTDTDWNQTGPSVYYVASGTAFTGANNPGNNSEIAPYTWGQLIVSRAGGGGILQVYAPHIGSNGEVNAGLRYRTGWNNAGWQVWSTLLDDRLWRKYIFCNKNINRSQLTVSDSTWNVIPSGAIDLFGLAFKDTALSNDTGDIRMWLQGKTTLHLQIDGAFHASEGFVGNVTGNCSGSAGSVAWSGITSKPTQWDASTAATLSGGLPTPRSTGHAYLCGNGVFISGPYTSNDCGWIRCTSSSESDFILEIATGDDGGAGESIVCRQYNTSNAVTHAVTLMDHSGYSHFVRAYNAVWNDYAEFRVADSEEPGRLVVPSNDGIARLATMRLQPGGRIISDTYGHAVGQSDQAKTPVGLAGRVLAYPYRDKSEYKIGDAVCSAPGGTVDIMTRDEIMTYPDRIVGIVNEIPDYEVWEQTFSEQSDSQTAQKIEVKGRIWIDIR